MKEQLERMRSLVEMTHWIQGAYRSVEEETGKVRYCLVGLINETCMTGEPGITGEELIEDENMGDAHQIASLLYDILDAELEAEFSQIEDWNDDLNTTKEDVLGLLNLALDRLK